MEAAGFHPKPQARIPRKFPLEFWRVKVVNQLCTLGMIIHFRRDLYTWDVWISMQWMTMGPNLTRSLTWSPLGCQLVLWICILVNWLGTEKRASNNISGFHFWWYPRFSCLWLLMYGFVSNRTDPNSIFSTAEAKNIALSCSIQRRPQAFIEHVLCRYSPLPSSGGEGV